MRNKTVCAFILAVILSMNSVYAFTAYWYDGYQTSAASIDVNFEYTSRQGGSPVPYLTNHDNDYHSQIVGTGDPMLLQLAGDGALAGAPTLVSPDKNFKGTSSGQVIGKAIYFELNVGNTIEGDPSSYVWAGITIGSANSLVAGDTAGSHFSIRFIQDVFGGNGNFLQFFDGDGFVDNLVANPAGDGWMTVWIEIDDPLDGNPWDGVGSTVITTYINGTLVNTYTKGSGGYTNNYITLEGSANTNGWGQATHVFDKLTVFNASALHDGDANLDGGVNLDDLVRVADNWLRDDCGPANAYCNGADFPSTRDGKVDMQDFNLLSANWGKEPPVEPTPGYYISFSQGDDANNGLSPETPWKTFANINSRVLEPGDNVFLRRGDTWNERMTLRGKGSAADWIYVGPYGDINDSAPKISLNNDRDDIAIVVQDFGDVPGFHTYMGYIHIDNLQIHNTRLGIYFRNLLSSEPVGFKVTDCHFYNISQPDVEFNVAHYWSGLGQQLMPYTGSYYFDGQDANGLSIWRRTSDNSIIPNTPDPATGRFLAYSNEPLAFFDGQMDYEVRVAKGHLDSLSPSFTYEPAGTGLGGSGEYVFPAAIFFGGRRGPSDGRIGFREIEISNIVLERTWFGIGGQFIFGPESNRDSFQDIRITDVTLYEGHTIFGFTDADYGNPTLNPDNHWGVFKNLNIMSGNSDFLFAGGTTGGFVESSSNGYFAYCNFSNVENGNSVAPPASKSWTPDGCGFDFEADGVNITIANSIFALNTGPGTLFLGDGNPRPPSQDITLTNNLFYNNLISAGDNNNYRWDNCVLTNHSGNNIVFSNNRYAHRLQTDGGVRPNNWINRENNNNNLWTGSRSYGNQTGGISETGATFRRENNLDRTFGADFMAEVNAKGLADALKVVTIEQKTN